MAAKKQQQRDLTILVRYRIKKDYAPKGLHAGDIVLLVRNEAGKEYYVTLRRNKAHSCTCVASAEYGKRCYHINNMAIAENARIAASRAAKVIVLPTQPVVSPEMVGVLPSEQSENCQQGKCHEPEPEFDAERHFWNPNLQCYCYRRMPNEPVAFLSDRPAPVVEAPKVEKVVDISKRMLDAPLTQNRAFSLLKVS